MANPPKRVGVLLTNETSALNEKWKKVDGWPRLI